MRIFVKALKDEGAVSSIAQEAFDALRNVGITSARIGGIINDQGVVLSMPPTALSHWPCFRARASQPLRMLPSRSLLPALLCSGRQSA